MAERMIESADTDEAKLTQLACRAIGEAGRRPAPIS